MESTGLLEVTGNSFISTSSRMGDNPMTIRADRIHVGEDSLFSSSTFVGNGGAVNMTARVFELSGGGTVATQTFGDGKAGDIHLTASERVSLLNHPEDPTPSGLHTDSFGSLKSGVHGDAGNITITTPRLDMNGGAHLSSATQTSGRSGNVTIIASDSVVMAGGRPSDVPDIPSQGLGETRASGIYTRTVGSTLCSGRCGDAGDVTVTAGSVTLTGGALINSGTTNNGQGGSVTIQASDRIQISGTLQDDTAGGLFTRTIGTTPDAGPGGNIALTAGQSVTISNGASVSASSTGPGNTGNIQINAGNLFTMTNSSVTTEANQASGGAIKITTDPERHGAAHQQHDQRVGPRRHGRRRQREHRSAVRHSAEQPDPRQRGAGTGREYLHHHQFPLAGREQYDHGLLAIRRERHHHDSIAERSDQRPDSAAGENTADRDVAAQPTCAALAGGEFSSFTVAGRDSLPTEPGSWLTSPLALAPAGFSAGAVAEAGAQARVIDPAQATPLLSLRQIAPAGFLTQAFAVDEPTGCQS